MISSPHVHCSLTHNSQDMEAAQVSTDGRMDKEDVVSECVCVCVHARTPVSVYTNSQEYYSTVKMKEILPFVTTWMDLEETVLTEISQTEKDNYHMISLICGT